MFYTNISTSYNGTIQYRGVDKNGDRVNFKDNYFKPKLYVNGGKSEIINDDTFRTLDNVPVNPIVFDSIADAKEHVDSYKGVDGYNIYGMTRWEYQYIGEKFKGKVDWDFSKLKIYILDIEVDSSNGFPNIKEAPEFITSIAIKELNTGIYNVWGYGDFETKDPNVNYHKVNNEEQLFLSFLDFWSSDYPDIITGWNTTFFDIPYLIQRALKLNLDSDIKKISPWNYYKAKQVFIQGREELIFDIQGIDDIDYIELYKKFTFTTQESYKLDYIGKTELGYGKTDDGASTGFDLFKTDHQKFIEYNMGDVDLIDGLDKKLKLMKLICTMAYGAKCNMSDVFSQVRTWDCMIYNYLNERNITIPFIKKSDKNSGIVGAYVKEVNARLYNNVVSFDIASLYPNIIRTLNIGPETYIDKDSKVNIDYILKYSDKKPEKPGAKKEPLKPLSDIGCVAANGVVYSKNKQSLFSQLVERTYNTRVEKRSEMMRLKKLDDDKYKQIIEDLDIEQYALKIQLNSLYGAIGNQYFRFYNRDNAEAITSTGQTIIQWIERAVNEALDRPKEGKMGEVFYCDTDSIFVELQPFIDRFSKGNPIDELDDLCKNHLEPAIAKSFDEYCNYVNAYKNHLVMKREAIADKGIWTAKKRYMLNVFDNEGVRYKEPKLKIMGIESVKSSTPQIFRKYIKEQINIMMNGTENQMRQFRSEMKKDLKNYDSFVKMKKNKIEDIFFPRSANNINIWYNKMERLDKVNPHYSDNAKITDFILKGPMHIRGCIIYNMLIDYHGLNKKYEKIKNGEKVKFAYVHDGYPLISNSLRVDVIAFKDNLPREFDIDKYIDFKTMFEKGADKPLIPILEARKWSFEDKVELDCGGSEIKPQAMPFMKTKKVNIEPMGRLF